MLKRESTLLMTNCCLECSRITPILYINNKRAGKKHFPLVVTAGVAMIKKPLEEYSQQGVNAFVQKSAFLRNLLLESPDQFHTLLKTSEIEVYQPDEVLEDKGDNAKKFFILLEGRLNVFNDAQKEPIGHVLAGQLVGALAVINRKPRSAHLKAARSEASLLAVDFSAFGALRDFSKIQLQTKICLYRAVAAFTFWKLDEYRYRNNDPFLEEGLSHYSEYTGDKNTLEELVHIAGGVSYLGGLLEKWNKSR